MQEYIVESGVWSRPSMEEQAKLCLHMLFVGEQEGKELKVMTGVAEPFDELSWSVCRQ